MESSTKSDSEPLPEPSFGPLSAAAAAWNAQPNPCVLGFSFFFVGFCFLVLRRCGLPLGHRGLGLGGTPPGAPCGAPCSPSGLELGTRPQDCPGTLGASAGLTSGELCLHDCKRCQNFAEKIDHSSQIFFVCPDHWEPILGGWGNQGEYARGNQRGPPDRAAHQEEE